MVKVLVLGATGYIGFPLCQSLRRDGHMVYGLARSADKARGLARHEIRTVVGTVEGGEYLDIVRKANIDIVVDASSANQGSYHVLEGLKAVSQQRLKTRGRHGPKLGFIYLGGSWVHGSSTAPVNDLSPVAVANDAGCPTQPPELVAWRPALEGAILDAREVLESVVVRPALLYGGSSSLWSLWSLWLSPIAKAASEGSSSGVHILADAAAQPGLIHVDDVVSAIHLTVGKFGSVSTASGNYPVFDIVSSSEPLKLILDAAAPTLRLEGSLTYDGPGDNAFAVAMNTTMRGSSTRARDLLGWAPKHTSMAEGIEAYVDAWNAHQ